MGDRCYIEFEFLKKDEKKFREALAEEIGEGADDVLEYVEYRGKVVFASFYEVNYGWCDELHAVAKAGILFHGFHGNGDSYGGQVFAAAAGKLYSIDASYDGFPVGVIGPDLAIDIETEERARAYFDALDQVKGLA